MAEINVIPGDANPRSQANVIGSQGSRVTREAARMGAKAVSSANVRPHQTESLHCVLAIGLRARL